MPRVIHFDISADDTGRAIGFYKKVFGWKVSKAHGPLEYWLITTGDAGLQGIDGGLAKRAADWQHIMMFVDVDFADDTADKVVNAGGRIIEPRTTIPGVGYVIGCEVTEGNAFAIIQRDDAAGF